MNAGRSRPRRPRRARRRPRHPGPLHPAHPRLYRRGPRRLETPPGRPAPTRPPAASSTNGNGPLPRPPDPARRLHRSRARAREPLPLAPPRPPLRQGPARHGPQRPGLLEPRPLRARLREERRRRRPRRQGSRRPRPPRHRDARRVPGGDARRARLEGLAWAAVGNALRVRRQLPAADASLPRSTSSGTRAPAPSTSSSTPPGLSTSKRRFDFREGASAAALDLLDRAFPLARSAAPAAASCCSGPRFSKSRAIRWKHWPASIRPAACPGKRANFITSSFLS